MFRMIGVLYIAAAFFVAKPVEAISYESPREELLMLFSGEWVSRGIYAATKLEIADHLQAGPKSVNELAELTSSDCDSLERLLHTLAGFGIFQEVSSKTYANSEMSKMLVKSDPNSLHALSVFYGEDIHKTWDGLLGAIQTGKPAFPAVFDKPVFAYFRDNPERAALFGEAMKAKTKAVIESALTTYDFSQARRVYDIGGGLGHFMKALLAMHSEMQGLVFELPEVVDSIVAHPRMSIVSGDFFKTVPKGGDVYLLKSVIHDWDDAESEKILKNCHSAMSSESKLLLVEVVLQPEDRSIYANCMDLLMLAVTGGKERSLESFRQMLDHAGFEMQRVIPTETEFSIIEAIKKS